MTSNWSKRYNGLLDADPNDLPPSYDSINDVTPELRHHEKREIYETYREPERKVTDLQNVKQQLQKVQNVNAETQQKIETAEKERNVLEKKIETLKTKLATTNSNVNKFSEERDKLRASLNESQIQVARLEERLTASTAELDRMRDPANPDSNMNVKKHIINVKKEIKKLRVDLEAERNNLEDAKKIAETKNNAISTEEKELRKLKADLAHRENELVSVNDAELEESIKKDETVEKIELLKLESKSYGQKLKDARVQLGVKTASKNVNVKLSREMKSTEKTMIKQLTMLEKKLKDALGELDILKKRHRMSKTAQSINTYTRRNRGTKEGLNGISFADSGVGNVKFTAAKDKFTLRNSVTNDKTKKASDKIRDKANGVNKVVSVTNRTKEKAETQTKVTNKVKTQPNETAIGEASVKLQSKKTTEQQRTTGTAQLQNRQTQRSSKDGGKITSGKDNSKVASGFVPQPKSKLKATHV